MSKQKPKCKCDRLGKLIAQMNETMHSKNLELDRLLKVWCTGGCPGGVGRWTGEELTLEEVEWAEKYAKRVRDRYKQRTYRLKQQNKS